MGNAPAILTALGTPAAIGPCPFPRSVLVGQAEPGQRVRMSRKLPWWQTTKTVRQGLLLGGVFAVIGLGDVVLAATGAANFWMLIIGAGFFAMGAAHLTSAIAMRKRQQPAAR